AGDAGLFVTLTNNTPGSGIMTVNIATYKANPTLSTIFNAGAFYDLQVFGADSSDTVVAGFYYPSTITGAAETSLQLLYWTGMVWAPVLGNGGALPVKDTTDNLDGSISG